VRVAVSRSDRSKFKGGNINTENGGENLEGTEEEEAGREHEGAPYAVSCECDKKRRSKRDSSSLRFSE
jgi:hypothetical protein